MSERNRVSGMIYNTNEKGWKYRTGEWAVMVTLLGHFLGNPHSYVKNNLMSYDRDGGKVFLDDAQGQKARKTARALFASKELVATKP